MTKKIHNIELPIDLYEFLEALALENKRAIKNQVSLDLISFYSKQKSKQEKDVQTDKSLTTV
jgi:hypothetical protein